MTQSSDVEYSSRQKGKVMDKTLKVEIEDLIQYLKNEIYQREESYAIYETDRETTFLSGINEGIGRALEVLKELEVEQYLKGNK